MGSPQLGIRRAIRRAHLVRLLLDQMAVMIAANAEDFAVHQQACGLGGCQRTAEVVTEIDDPVDTLRPDILQDA